MKLQCQVDVVNRMYSAINVRSGGNKYARSTLALGKEPRGTGYFILLFSGANKTGARYPINDNIKQVFVKCINEGKATIRFTEPPHDICIRGEAIQLKCFMKLLRNCLAGNGDVQLANISNISVIAKDPAPTRMVIRSRADLPAKGFPRTLQTLELNGLKMCNFRREILQLKHLTILDLGNNEIERLPPELGTMQCISELYLGNNKLGLREAVDWRWLLGAKLSKSLRYLDLSHNNLSNIPRSLWKLTGLVTLKLNNNRLSALPHSIGRITTLKFLHIFHNQLKSLPCSLMQCKLEYIDLSHNLFEELDEESSKRTRSAWDLYVGGLTSLAACAVLKHRLPYDRTTIPFTLVDFLDDSCVCVCGLPVVHKTQYKRCGYDMRDFFATVIFEEISGHSVNFDCYFCSSRCYQKSIA